MDISNESLKLLESVIFNNPKHSPMGHPCDYGGWIEFIIETYRNDDCIKSWDLHDYFMDNGFGNFKDEVEKLTENYVYIHDFIRFVDIIKDDSSLQNVQWLIEKLNS